MSDDTGFTNKADFILAWDRKQSISVADAEALAKRMTLDLTTGELVSDPIIVEPGVKCSRNPDHGRLTMHGSGLALMCGRCDEVVPVDRVMHA